jgi:chemotaxis receptor (MCP) glutamine deamidase CheD
LRPAKAKIIGAAAAHQNFSNEMSVGRKNFHAVTGSGPNPTVNVTAKSVRKAAADGAKNPAARQRVAAGDVGS